jgi:hypothetical protein
MSSKNNDHRLDCSNDEEDTLSLRSRAIRRSPIPQQRQHRKAEPAPLSYDDKRDTDVLSSSATGKWNLPPWCLATGLMTLPLCLLVVVCLAICSPNALGLGPVVQSEGTISLWIFDPARDWLRRCNRCKDGIDVLKDMVDVVAFALIDGVQAAADGLSLFLLVAMPRIWDFCTTCESVGIDPGILFFAGVGVAISGAMSCCWYCCCFRRCRRRCWRQRLDQKVGG